MWNLFVSLITIFLEISVTVLLKKLNVNWNQLGCLISCCKLKWKSFFPFKLHLLPLFDFNRKKKSKKRKTRMKNWHELYDAPSMKINSILKQHQSSSQFIIGLLHSSPVCIYQFCTSLGKSTTPNWIAIDLVVQQNMYFFFLLINLLSLFSTREYQQ